MINNISDKMLMRIPDIFRELYQDGRVIRKGAILKATEDLEIVKDGIKTLYKKGAIVGHIEDITEDLKVSEVTAAIDKAAEAADKAASAANLATTASVGIGVGVVLAVGVGVYLINKSIKCINAQIDKSTKELYQIKVGIDDLKDILDSQIDAKFTSQLKLLKTAIEEKNISRIYEYRDNFVEIADFSMKQCQKIIEKGNVVRLLETFKKYILMYYVSMQSVIRCSLFINQFTTAKNYTEDSCKQLEDLLKKYSEFLLNSSGNVFFDCPVESLVELPTIKPSLRLMSLVLKDNISIIKQLEPELQTLQSTENSQTQAFNLPYLDYEIETNKRIG
ncbi:hypothetical protein [uncultured Succiniclasticum sp.]|uniref:hypothetical protein n=1 Tax=uncultured Succiniclasticum sp. TaxID=1500547 RepID=UPI0025F0D8B6|nr:hypothetical protein [uncultured Succiniclasticum sp.]